jgi:hypothetical protein
MKDFWQFQTLEIAHPELGSITWMLQAVFVYHWMHETVIYK